MMANTSTLKNEIDLRTDSTNPVSKGCPLCRVSLEPIKIELPLFQHLGFVDLDQNGIVGRCPECQLLINMLSVLQQKKIDAVYQSDKYAQGNITNQTYYVKDLDKSVTRSFLQAEMLQKSLPKKNSTRVLDIGCFDGALLRELSFLVPEAQFHGFDVNGHLKALFPKDKNFTFWSTELKDINEQFDLITMSCSMMYIKDIKTLFEQVKRLLKPEGTLFIQMPDMVKNRYSVLLADQYFYFTPQILKNVLNQNGFGFELVENDLFPRDILVVAKLADQQVTVPNEEDLSINEIVAYLLKQRKQLNAITSKSDLCVLGTTVTAAFVDSILGGKNQFFVDENVNRTNNLFRGKKVVHPKELDSSAKLILSYGPSNAAIKKRFLSEYNLNNFEELG